MPIDPADAALLIRESLEVLESSLAERNAYRRTLEKIRWQHHYDVKGHGRPICAYCGVEQTNHGFEVGCKLNLLLGP